MPETIINIPTFADRSPRWLMSVDLSGKRYQLYFDWNTRFEIWSMSILDANGKNLLGGLGVVPYFPLYDRYRASVPQLPSGDLIILDRQDNMQTAVITRDNLGSRFVLCYVEAAG